MLLSTNRMIFILKTELYLRLVWKLRLVVIAKVYKQEEGDVNGSADHKNYGIHVSAEFEYTAVYYYYYALKH